MKSLTTAKQVKLSASIEKVSRSGSRHELTATVRNRGTAVAAMVRLSLLDGEDGSRVLPTLYSHNYVWLLPGESQTVTLSWPAGALRSGRPTLEAEAYNSSPTRARS